MGGYSAIMDNGELLLVSVTALSHRDKLIVGSRYLKQEISAPVYSSNQPGRFTSVAWHPEQALHLILTTPSRSLRFSRSHPAIELNLS
jgi:hypothetical protein